MILRAVLFFIVSMIRGTVLRADTAPLSATASKPTEKSQIQLVQDQVVLQTINRCWNRIGLPNEESDMMFQTTRTIGRSAS